MSGISNTTASRGPNDDASAPAHLTTLAQVQQWRAQTRPTDSSFTFLRDGELDAVTLTYAELDQRAAALAAHLVRRGATGQPVLLVFEPGIDYVVAFFACLYAEAIAVPVYPPDPFNLPRTLPRLQAIVENAGAQWLLTTEELAEKTRLDQIRAELLLVHQLDLDIEPIRRGGEASTNALLQYTSGSTGTPRGVIINHGNLMHNFQAMHRMFDVEDAVVAHWLPPYHDMGLIGCLLLPIYSGRHTVAMSPFAFMQKPIRWLQAVARYRATTSGAPNFGYELCVRKIKPQQCEGLDLSSWRVAVTGAEPVRAATLDAFASKFAPFGFRKETFLPAFGMAEATLIVSGEHQSSLPRCEEFRLDQLEQRRVTPALGSEPSRRLVGCGAPAHQVRVRIVDPDSRLPLEENQIGEIWLQSPGVGAGYWREPELTRELFRAAVANESAEQRYLRTGDLGFLRDGELFVTGRRKELIILGGRNLYPLDLEQAVQGSHPDLKMDGGAAFSIDVDGEETLVVVQEVLRPKRHDLDRLLSAACEALVAEAGVAPHALLLISAGSLPKTSSGKTRRGECRRQYLEGGLRVLAQWPLPEASVESGATPPVSETERRLAEIWEEVLAVDSVGLEDDFFLLGAKSIRIAAMLGRVSEWLERDVPLKLLFKNSTLQSFARALDALQGEAQQGEHFEKLPSAASHNVAPLTDAQHRFWFLEKLQSQNAPPGLTGVAGVGQSLHIPLELELRGDVAPDAIHKRLQTILHRHEILRVSFHERDGQPEQKLHEEVEFPWTVVDLRVEGDSHSALLQWRREVCESPMPLDRAPLARASLARVEQDRWRLCIVVHHLVADGWSMGLLLQQLSDVDRSPPQAPGYLSYATWQANHAIADQAEAEAESAQQVYWRKRLKDAPGSLELAAGDARDPRAGSVRVELDDVLSGAIRQHTRESAATPFMFYMAAFQAVLSRYADVEDLVVGAITANRRRPICEQMFGCFINTVAMRADLSDDPTLESYLQRVRHQVIADLDHGSYPFERLIEDLNPPREAGRLPLVQAMLLLQESPDIPNRVGGGCVTTVEAGQAGLAEFDVALVLEPTAGSVAITLHYQYRSLAPDAAQRFLDSYVATLACFLDSPHQALSQLPIPSKPERLELLVDHNATDRAHVTHDPLEMLESGAEGRDERPAVWFAGEVARYGALHAQANRVARRLQYLGVGPDVPVAIRMPRGPDLVAAMLAVLKAGGAFVPLDGSHPVARQQAILDDCRPRLVIEGTGESCPDASAPTSSSIAWQQLVEEAAGESNRTLHQNAGEDHLAYIIYTSGTTGTPKGVMVTRGGLGNFLQAFARTQGLSEHDRILAHTTVSFDISILELLLPLCVGAEMVLAPCNAGRDPRALLALIEQREVTFIQATPSGFRMWRDAGWQPQAGRGALTLLVGGEALSADLADFLLTDERPVKVWNVYGPTETTIWSTISRVTPDELEHCRTHGSSPSIGRPIDNTQVYVLDQRRRPAPIGVVGDLYIGGAGVARGYWNNSELTRASFLDNDYLDQPGHRLYRTGDRVRWRADGVLEFFGRNDAQAKIRGFRVELGEIEAALLSHPSVLEAAVICRRAGEDAELAAYVVWEGEPDDAAVREHLAQRLPGYMQPSHLVALDEMPTSSAGKVDRKRLPDGARTQAPKQAQSPTTPLEIAVADAWAEVLGQRAFGLDDRFFEIGGHSLKAVRMLSRLETAYDVQLDVPAFFADPTISGCASQLLVAMAQQDNQLEQLLAEIEGQDRVDSDASQSK